MFPDAFADVVSTCLFGYVAVDADDDRARLCVTSPDAEDDFGIAGSTLSRGHTEQFNPRVFLCDHLTGNAPGFG
jgi:hypothetical protein